MRRTRARRTLTGAVIAAAMLIHIAPASAAPITLFTASDFFIPRPASATDQEGVLRQIADFDLAANGFGALIGQECLFTVSADNGDSVNENNYGIIRTNGEETDVYDTESLPDVTSTILEDERLILGPTIEMFNVMIPDAGDIVGTSVDFTVTIDCDAAPVTTTTAPTTTTTAAATTTTTAPGTTSTSGQPTTTSSVPSASTTTELIATSTSDPSSTSDSGGDSTTIPPVTEGTLPFTGSGAEVALLASAFALVLLGGAGVISARPPGRHTRRWPAP